MLPAVRMHGVAAVPRLGLLLRATPRGTNAGYSRIEIVMFSATADLYDLIYSFKDYTGEAEKVRQVINRERPGAKTILDVACGTGEHARFLSANFSVDGIDIDPAFVKIAQGKNPLGNFSVADMRSFELHKRYDVVQCLFSSIGYLLTSADVVSAFRCFRDHLAPDGVVMVEPWLSPTEYKVGSIHMLTVDRPDLKICRMNVAKHEGDISILNFHYLTVTREGVRRMEETHRLVLISSEEMASHFRAAHLGCTFDPVGLNGRGLFVARPVDAR